MTQRERILAVYRNEVPDAVPFMLDLSHWFYHRLGQPWDLSQSYLEPERGLIDYHRAAGVGFYMPNLGAFVEVSHEPDVRASVQRSGDGQEIVWTYETPRGMIRRVRRWNAQSYSWGIVEWGIKCEPDLEVLRCALAGRSYTPRWERYRAWEEYVGGLGVVYLPMGYSAIGQLMHYWMGVEGTIYACAEWPETVRAVVDAINANNLLCVDLLVQSPAEIIIMGDNFSGDIQPPHFFAEWSREYYVEAIRRLHAAGKYVSVHIDGRLRGALAMIRDTGADCADAVTPAPFGDLDPEQCRAEAGTDFILSGGVPPNLWLPDAPVEEFEAAVRRWLELKRYGPRLIAAAGDQVPPGADEDRIFRMRDLVEAHGGY